MRALKPGLAQSLEEVALEEPVSLAELLACVDRDLGFRERWVSRHPGKMMPQAAQRELEHMRAVRARLVRSAALYIVALQLAVAAGVDDDAVGRMLAKAEALVHGLYPKLN